MSGKTKQAWEDFVTTIKKIGIVWGVLGSLGFGGVATAGMEAYKTIHKNGKAVQFLIENQVMMKLEFKRSNLESSISKYKRELRDLRRQFGGVGAPLGEDMDKEDYIEATADLEQAKTDLAVVKAEIAIIKKAEMEKLKKKKEE